MKKQLLLVLGCSLLSACVVHETDLYAAQEKRDAALAQKRSQMGCTFIRDHDAYRQCILNTYYLQQPQGYETRELTTGQPVAVISTSACGPAGCGSKVAPLPPSGPQIVPYSTTESQTVETTCTQNYQAREASVTTTEVIPAPAPVQIITQTAPAPAPAPVAEPAPVAAPAPAPAPVPVAPDPDPTWWETYQAEKKPEPVPAQPVCPCPDPNDPCPQCFDK